MPSALDFPASPSIGQTYPNPPVTGQPTYRWDGAQWLSTFALGKAYVPLDGSDPMTGLLTLSGPPVNPLHAVTKTYADTAAATGAVRYDAVQSLTSAQQLQARTNIAAQLRGYIAGLTLNAVGGSGQFTITAGEAADSTNTDLMRLPSTYIKNTASWAVGASAGGLDTGAIAANTWYHVYQIKQPSTGTVDVCYSLSASAPTTGGANPIPAGVLFRRIGSIKTDGSSQWVGFNQIGDEYLWLARVVDVAATGMTTSAVLHTLTVPSGVQVNALFSARAIYNTNAGVYMFTSPDENDLAPNGDTASLVVGASGTSNAAHFNIRTNTSRQIRGRANVTVSTITITTFGWIDRRGRDG